ncbi:MAG: VWA domain-containing protein [Thermoplasmata archaeon]
MVDRGEDVAAILRSRISGFCEILRRRGCPAGIGAEVDLARAMDAIDLTDRLRFRAACGATLARSPEELRTVYAAFDAYWDPAPPRGELPAPGAESASLAPRRERPEAPGADRDGATELERPPVVIPIGTYSRAAPPSPRSPPPLGERELRRIRHGVRRFRRDLAAVPGRRRGPSRRGAVDLRDTVRQSLRYGGEWVELRRERPRRTRAEFVVLWDVSGSMREHESRFFALVHALQSASRPSRVFAFSTRVEEITSEVRRNRYRRATVAVGRRIGRADGGTRIARSLREFDARYGASLGGRSSLVVLSDGWDLGEAERVRDPLERLHRRANRVVWVTPYTRRPGFEPRVGALRAALGEVDLLLGPEDFESRWPLPPYRY